MATNPEAARARLCGLRNTLTRLIEEPSRIGEYDDSLEYTADLTIGDLRELRRLLDAPGPGAAIAVLEEIESAERAMGETDDPYDQDAAHHRGFAETISEAKNRIRALPPGACQQAKCVECGKTVWTCEAEECDNPEHRDGCSVADDAAWVCSRPCWERFAARYDDPTPAAAVAVLEEMKLNAQANCDGAHDEGYAREEYAKGEVLWEAIRRIRALPPGACCEAAVQAERARTPQTTTITIEIERAKREERRRVLEDLNEKSGTVVGRIGLLDEVRHQLAALDREEQRSTFGVEIRGGPDCPNGHGPMSVAEGENWRIARCTTCDHEVILDREEQGGGDG